MKHLLSFISIVLAFAKINSKVNGSTVKIACLVNQNIHIRLVYNTSDYRNYSNNYTFGWSFEDPISNKNGDISNTNDLKIQENSNATFDLNNRYRFDLKDTNDTVINELSILSLGVEDYAKRFSYFRKEKSSNLTNIELKYETLVLNDQAECSINSPNAELASIPKQISSQKFITLTRNQTIKFYCSINAHRLRSNQSEDKSMIIKWYTEKEADYNSFEKSLIFGNGFKTIDLNHSSSFNTIFWEEITYSVPSDNVLAWQHNNLQLFCRIGHANYFDGSFLVDSENSAFKHSAGAYTNPIKKLNCNFYLNIKFDPFIYEKVNKTQVLNESVPGHIECPIKASYLPAKYYIEWYFKSKTSKIWELRLRTDFDSPSAVYLVDNPSLELYNDSKFKCKLYEMNRFNHHFHYEHNIQSLSNNTKPAILKSIISVIVQPKCLKNCGTIYFKTEISKKSCDVLVVFFILVLILLGFTISFGIYVMKKRGFYCIRKDSNRSGVVSKIIIGLPKSYAPEPLHYATIDDIYYESRADLNRKDGLLKTHRYNGPPLAISDTDQDDEDESFEKTKPRTKKNRVDPNQSELVSGPVVRFAKEEENQEPDDVPLRSILKTSTKLAFQKHLPFPITNNNLEDSDIYENLSDMNSDKMINRETLVEDYENVLKEIDEDYKPNQHLLYASKEGEYFYEKTNKPSDIQVSDYVDQSETEEIKSKETN